MCLIAAGALISPAHAAETAATCTLEQVWSAPASVEAPCTALLSSMNLTQEQRAQALFVRGRGYQYTHRLDQAAADFDAALAIVPAYDDALVARANIDFRRNAFDSGVERLLDGIAINPKNANAYRALGQAYFRRNAIPEAINYYGKALAADPLEPYARYFRSDLYMRLQRYPEAIADADALVALDPAVINRPGFLDERGRLQDFHVLALDHRGMLFQLTGENDRAEADFDAAIAFNATSTDAFSARARFRVANQQFDAALADADRAISLEPQNDWAYQPRAEALFRLGRFDDALSDATEAVKRQPYWAPVYILRAKILRGLGRADDAATDFETALSLDGGSSGGLAALIRAGYWPPRKPVTALTVELDDAVHACMLDQACN
jgi:tetratricopeptide (TPR) repeat protein